MSKKVSSEKPPHYPQNFPIVGVGASAGGFEAFKGFIETLPTDSGMAFVLIQHLAPDHESVLPKLLSPFTSLPVFEIEDEINLAPNTVYILPKKKILTTTDGVLKLSPLEDLNKRSKPIDLFFSSLAEVHKSFAIGIILSGTGFDGTLGLKKIKELGGITYAQTPETATFDGMPKSAINAGAVDFVLNVEEMPEHLTKIGKAYETNYAHSEENEVPQTEEEVYKSIIRILRLRTGNDFTHYKQATFRRRIARRMLLTKKEEPQLYLDYLRNERSEQDALFNDVLIPVSYFFRDTKTFEALCETVIPEILKGKTSNDPIRIWVAGCSTGEEAYSLAISIHELLAERAPGMKVSIFASDISENVITKARAAMYTEQDLQNVSETRLQNYFVKSNGSYHISKVIRDMCIFAVHNFLKDPPFAKMDLVSCRNVLIYFNPFMQKKALTTFHYALKEKGILLLGKSETASNLSNLFEPIIKYHKIYSRKSVPGRFIPATFEPADNYAQEKGITSRKKASSEPDFQKLAYEILFSKYTPCGVIINEHKDIVHFHGDTSAFLIPSPGKPNFNVLKMAREGLAFEIRNALLKAKKYNETTKKEKISVKDLNYLVSIEAIPLHTGTEPHTLLLFQKSDIAVEEKQNTSQKKSNDQLRVKQLEAEIAQIRKDIRRVTEDQEAANEELQSANEELLSNSEELQTLNEELETSAEELQSNNEELISVNDELMDRQDQLTASRAYAEAIVETIREPLLILDKDLRIKSANASFYRYFKTNEEESEGKSFFEIGNGRWNINDLKAQLENVLPHKSKLEDFEVDLELPDGNHYSFLLNAKKIENDKHSDELILLAFEDITEHQIIKILTESEERFRVLADSAPVMLWLSGIDKVGYFFNKGWLDFTGRTMEQESNEGWLENIHPDDYEKTLAIFNTTFEKRKEFQTEYRLKRHDGEYRWIVDKAVPRYTTDGIFLGYVGSCMDVHEQKNFANEIEGKVIARTEELKQSQAFLESILNTTDNVVSLYDFEQSRNIFFNENILKLTGYSSKELVNSEIDVYQSLIHPDDLHRFEQHRTAIKSLKNDKIADLQYRLKDKKGELKYLLTRDLVFKRDDDGNVIQYIATTTDISAIKVANELVVSKNNELEHSNNELSTFTSIASHDLKEPLRKINIYSKLLKDRESEGLSETANYNLDRIIFSVEKMQRLIEDLLGYSEINAHKVTFKLSNLNELLEEIQGDMYDLIEETNTQLTMDDLPTMKVIPSQFLQLFTNLISNAIKYRKDDEKPKIKITRTDINGSDLKDIGAESKFNYCKISVSDNGIGFIPEFSEKIFEPFRRLHDKEKYSGTGIGLAICKKIINNHKGLIFASSEVGKGSRFDVYIPFLK